MSEYKYMLGQTKINFYNIDCTALYIYSAFKKTF